MLRKKIDQFLSRNDFSQATVKTYSVALQHLQNFVDTSIVLTDRPERWIDDFAKFLEKGEMSGKTIQAYLNVAKIFYRWSGIPVEYTYRVSKKEIQRNKKKQSKRWFTESEIAQLRSFEFFESPNEHPNRFAHMAVVNLLIDTGARVGEIAEVKWKDISIEEGIIWLGTSKTAMRFAFFSPRTGNLIAQWKEVTKDAGSEDLAFFPVQTIQNAVNFALKKLGMKNGERDGRGPHTFRHYAASRMYFKARLPIPVIEQILGDKWETIKNNYLHLDPFVGRQIVYERMGWEDESGP